MVSKLLLLAGFTGHNIRCLVNCDREELHPGDSVLWELLDSARSLFVLCKLSDLDPLCIGIVSCLYYSRLPTSPTPRVSQLSELH